MSAQTSSSDLLLAQLSPLDIQCDSLQTTSSIVSDGGVQANNGLNAIAASSFDDGLFYTDGAGNVYLGTATFGGGLVVIGPTGIYSDGGSVITDGSGNFQAATLSVAGTIIDGTGNLLCISNITTNDAIYWGGSGALNNDGSLTIGSGEMVLANDGSIYAAGGNFLVYSSGDILASSLTWGGSSLNADGTINCEGVNLDGGDISNGGVGNFSNLVLSSDASHVVAGNGAFITIASISAADKLVTNAAPTTGTTVNAAGVDQDELLYIQPAGTLLALTIQLEPGGGVTADIGDIKEIFISQIITGLTVSATGGTVRGTALTTSSAVNGSYEYIKVTSTDWLRIR